MTIPDAAPAQRLAEVAGLSFIEVQFPVSKLSKESYKERMANASQTLTGLGKWWGRKPLVLVRAIILGLLLPATDDPATDRDVFLKLMTMDDEGLWRRVRSSIPVRDVYEHCLPNEREEFFQKDAPRPTWRKRLDRATKESVQRRAFFRMSYDEKLEHCVRPEEIAGPSAEAWSAINAHLGTQATDLVELVRELGERRFGHTPRVGDAFCGGGSIPFEAARLGCDVYASDLNPVAALLTWGALNILGGGKEVVDRVHTAQHRVYEALCRHVEEWGIKRSEDGWVADAYLYCNEAVDPDTGWKVPLAGSWVIGEGTRTIGRLVPDPVNRRFAIEIIQGASDEEIAQARTEATWDDGVRCPVDRVGNWLTPSRRHTTSFGQLVGRGGLRLWENNDVIPQPGDVIQERLYAIRWVRSLTSDNGKTERVRRYRAPSRIDLNNEGRVLALLRERLTYWQAKGFVPSRRVESGDETSRLGRERGWTHWHHLFNPRQLLLIGTLAELSETRSFTHLERVALLLATGRVADWNSRLSRWDPSGANEKGAQTFYNQALNTLTTYSTRTVASISRTIERDLHEAGVANRQVLVEVTDARGVESNVDMWVTDPGYGDAVNYEELSEFFLAVYEKQLPQLFPDWYTDSRRALAVRGTGETFRVAMAECYRNLAAHTSDDGFQVVTFTHQDPEVWADLTLVLWASGLHVTSAWTVATETSASGLKEGNYVQGTVVLILRKLKDRRRGDFAEVYPEVEDEVARQIASMTEIDDRDDPNFGDADFQLAAYAAALRVLTGYARIEDVDIERELRRGKGEKSPLAMFIGRAVEIASNYLVPSGLDGDTWRKLGPDERFYLKGIDVEAKGEHRDGVYQEFARGLGVKEYRGLLASNTANEVRLRTPAEFGGRDFGGSGFGATLLRKTLFAIHTTARDAEHDPRPARDYLHREVDGYWEKRRTILALLHFLVDRPKPDGGMAHWATDVVAARLLLAAIENDRA